MAQNIARQRVLIPPVLHAKFRPIVIERGHSNSVLAWCWLWNAVRVAGRGGSLPSAQGISPVWVRTAKEIKWAQRAEEYQRWAQTLRYAGSSPAAVIMAEIEAYIDEGGDPLANLIYS